MPSTGEPFVNNESATKRILFVNESAGQHSSVPDCLAAFDRHDISEAAHVLTPLTNPDQRGLDSVIVAVWGGDGSVRSVASLLVGSSATLLPCPGGTFNHFSRSVGINDEASVALALRCGEVTAIDIGAVGTDYFLNNLSIGWYTDLVSRRERYERRVPRSVAKAASLAMQIVRTRRVRIVVDGKPERIWLFWVGNGEYSVATTRLTERSSLEDGVLDVRLLRAGSHWPKVRALLVLLLQRTETSRVVDRRITASTSASFRSSQVRAALDGELVTLDSPLRITIARKSLRVLRVPEGIDRDQPTQSNARQIVGITCSDPLLKEV